MGTQGGNHSSFEGGVATSRGSNGVFTWHKNGTRTSVTFQNVNIFPYRWGILEWSKCLYWHGWVVEYRVSEDGTPVQGTGLAH